MKSFIVAVIISSVLGDGLLQNGAIRTKISSSGDVISPHDTHSYSHTSSYQDLAVNGQHTGRYHENSRLNDREIANVHRNWEDTTKPNRDDLVQDGIQEARTKWSTHQGSFDDQENEVKNRLDKFRDDFQSKFSNDNSMLGSSIFNDNYRLGAFNDSPRQLDAFSGFPHQIGAYNSFPHQIGTFGGFPQVDAFSSFPHQIGAFGGIPQQFNAFNSFPHHGDVFADYPLLRSHFLGYPFEGGAFSHINDAISQGFPQLAQQSRFRHYGSFDHPARDYNSAYGNILSTPRNVKDVELSNGSSLLDNYKPVGDVRPTEESDRLTNFHKDFAQLHRDLYSRMNESRESFNTGRFPIFNNDNFNQNPKLGGEIGIPKPDEVTRREPQEDRDWMKSLDARLRALESSLLVLLRETRDKSRQPEQASTAVKRPNPADNNNTPQVQNPISGNNNTPAREQIPVNSGTPVQIREPVNAPAPVRN